MVTLGALGYYVLKEFKQTVVIVEGSLWKVEGICGFDGEGQKIRRELAEVAKST